MPSHHVQAASTSSSVSAPTTSSDSQGRGGWWIDGNWYPPGCWPPALERRHRN